jgi:3-oxoacyl-[acyl-carrier protein] reductase
MVVNKNILVSGVSRGLGLEIAINLLEKGANIYGLSRTKSHEIEILMQKYPNSFYYLQIDLVNAANIKKTIFNDWIGNKTPIHGFINNAAIAYDDIITNINLDKLIDMFSINVFTPYMMVKNVIRNMLLNNIKGSIVHLSSISVHTGYKGLAMYAGSKGALEGFSKNTAREWGERGIRSNCLVAGFMETAMSEKLSDEQKDRIYKRTALKIPTSITSVAETIAFLMSDFSISITGQNIHVDSGTI